MRRMKLLSFVLILIFSVVLCNSEEFVLDAEDNAATGRDPNQQIEFDDLVLKVNEVTLQSVLKKINLGLIFFYEDNCEICGTILTQYKLAAQTIIRLSPPVGVFKVKCSENKKLCNDVRKTEGPFVIWVNRDNYGYVTEMSSLGFIKAAELMSGFSDVKIMEEKEELRELIINKSYYRVIALFPKLETIKDENISSNFQNSAAYEELFDKAMKDSFLMTSGEFQVVKIHDFNLFSDAIDVKIDVPSIITYTKGNLFDLTTSLSLQPSSLESLSSNYEFIKDLNTNRTHLLKLDKDPKLYSPENFVKLILLNSLQSIFPLTPNIFTVVFSGPILQQFVYLLSPKHNREENLKKLQNYNNISRSFREKGHMVWFGFGIFEGEIKEMLGAEVAEFYKNEEKDFPLLVFFNFHKKADEAQSTDVDKFLFKKELNLENLERFFQESNTRNSTSSGYKVENSELTENIEYTKFSNFTDLPKVVGTNFDELVMEFPDNVLVFIHDSNPEKSNLHNKWFFLLNIVRKHADPKVLRIYKFNAEINDVFSTKLPSKFPTLRMFLRHTKQAPLDYNHEAKIETLAQFLNHLIPTLQLNFSTEQLATINHQLENDSMFKYEEKPENNIEDEPTNSLIDDPSEAQQDKKTDL